MSYWVYILCCADDTLYTGITNDIDRRLTVHNSGKGAKYTRGRIPAKVVYQEECADKPAALRREAEIKRMTKEAKCKLIAGGKGILMKLETKRLVLRPWLEDDAAAVYQYAKDPRVGPMAGWPVHTSIEDSRRIIKDVLMTDETYAVVLKGETEPIGSIGLMIGEKSNLGISSNEGEIGYWIGVPYWGQGLIPEAVCELMRHGFQDLKLECIWCGYFDGNEKSRRVQEKCGFLYHHTEREKPYPLINEVKTQHVTCISKEQWENRVL